MSLVEAEEVPEARSFCSIRSTRMPRPAASRAMPTPLMPPPMMARAKSAMAVPNPGAPSMAREAIAAQGGVWHFGLQSMIPKSGDRFSEKIMLQQEDRVG